MANVTNNLAYSSNESLVNVVMPSGTALSVRKGEFPINDVVAKIFAKQEQFEKQYPQMESTVHVFIYTLFANEVFQKDVSVIRMALQQKTDELAEQFFKKLYPDWGLIEKVDDDQGQILYFFDGEEVRDAYPNGRMKALEQFASNCIIDEEINEGLYHPFGLSRKLLPEKTELKVGKYEITMICSSNMDHFLSNVQKVTEQTHILYRSDQPTRQREIAEYVFYTISKSALPTDEKEKRNLLNSIEELELFKARQSGRMASFYTAIESNALFSINRGLGTLLGKGSHSEVLQFQAINSKDEKEEGLTIKRGKVAREVQLLDEIWNRIEKRWGKATIRGVLPKPLFALPDVWNRKGKDCFVIKKYPYVLLRMVNFTSERAWQILEGFWRLSEIGVVHLDMKPHNILCNVREGVIADYGHAFLLPEGEIDIQELCHNVKKYGMVMSPEYGDADLWNQIQSLVRNPEESNKPDFVPKLLDLFYKLQVTEIGLTLFYGFTYGSAYHVKAFKDESTEENFAKDRSTPDFTAPFGLVDRFKTGELCPLDLAEVIYSMIVPNPNDRLSKEDLKKHLILQKLI